MGGRYLINLVLIIFLFLGGVPFNSTQQDGEGLDILFLLDQSRSMARINSGGIPNDPLGLRFYALWYAMYWMGEDQLLVHPNATFRMAIANFGATVEPWNFGDDPQNPQYWRTIASTSRDEWNSLYSDLTVNIDQLREEFSQRDLNNTDFLGAFRLARTLFEELPVASIGRQRVIVVLTDGQPWIKEPDFTVKDHMTEVQQYVARYFPKPSYRVYVVGMIDNEEIYWPQVEHHWENVTDDPCTSWSCPNTNQDRASLVASNDDVGKRFQEILQDLTKTLTLPTGVEVVDKAVVPGPLVVPPYLKSITFTYFKIQPQQRLIVNDPQGQIDHTRSGVTIGRHGGPIEIVRIADPLPGEWYISTDPPAVDVDISMRQIFAQSRLDSPYGFQIQFVPVTIRYALLNESGEMLPSYTDSRYDLDVTATILADGQSWPVSLTGEPGNIYKGEFTPVVDGLHTIQVSAKSQDLNGDSVEIFNGEIGTFDVSPILIVPVDIPTHWPQFKEKTIDFTLQDKNGSPVHIPSPLNISVTVGGEETLPINLHPQPDGIYQATFAPQQTGKHTIHVLATLVSDDGTKYHVYEAEVAVFDVTPTVSLELVRITPAESNIRQNNTSLWPFSLAPMVLEIQLKATGPSSQPIDPKSVFVGNPEEALEILVNGEPGILLHQPAEELGLYRWETHELGLGEYDLQVVVVGKVRPGYHIITEGASVHIVRAPHPLHIPLAAVIIFLVLAGGGVTIYLRQRQDRLRRHPCSGRLYIVDAYGAQKHVTYLSHKNANQIEIKGSEINPLTHVAKMLVTCPSEMESQSGQVQVDVWLDKNQAPFTFTLPAFGEVKLSPYNFWLVKTMESYDEQDSEKKLDIEDRISEYIYKDRSNEISQDVQ